MLGAIQIIPNTLGQCFPKTGPGTIYGPPKSLKWSVRIFLEPKHAKIWYMIQSVILLVKSCLKWSAEQFCVPREKILDFMVRDLKKFGKYCSRGWQSVTRTFLLYKLRKVQTKCRVLFEWLLTAYFISVHKVKSS